MKHIQQIEKYWDTTRGVLIVGTVVLGIILCSKGHAFGFTCDIDTQGGSMEAHRQEADRERENERNWESFERWRDGEGDERDAERAGQWYSDNMV